jgi:hypothetical protein
MRRLPKTVVAGLVWATSASMLMAGTPFLVCRCPGGDVKLFSSTSTKSSCCSGTGCPCEGGAAPCCGHKSAPVHKQDKDHGTDVNNPGDGSILVKADCEKALVQVHVSAVNPQDNKLAQSSPPSLYVQCDVICATAAASSIPRLVVWQLDRLPPPTDLVTSLQRLTI